MNIAMILDKFNSMVSRDIALETIILALCISTVVGIIIAFVYKRTHDGFSYAASFNFTLLMVTIIVAVIMMVIGSNIALSLGLIGSLSIIRFRTVVKDTKDMAYLFWAIMEGLAVGTGNYVTAFVSLAFISIIIIFLKKNNFSKIVNKSYIMIIHVNPESNDLTEEIIGQLIGQYKIRGHMRSSHLDKTTSLKEITYELYPAAKQERLDNLLKKLNESKDVRKISMLTPESNLFI